MMNMKMKMKMNMNGQTPDIISQQIKDKGLT